MNTAPDNKTDKGGLLFMSSLLSLGLILLATVQSLLYIAPSAVWKTCGLYHLETHTDSRLSGLAAKQLSAIVVAPGASSLEAQEVNTLISLEWCVLICQHVLLICALLSGTAMLSQNSG